MGGLNLSRSHTGVEFVEEEEILIKFFIAKKPKIERESGFLTLVMLNTGRNPVIRMKMNEIVQLSNWNFFREIALAKS